MPWTKSSPPDVAKNKPADQIEACVLAANRTLERGGTDEEAIFACVGAMKAVAKKATVNKQNFSTKQERKLPSHIPSPEIIKQRYEALEEEQKQDVKKAVLLPAFLAKHSLSEGVDRNILAMNFDSKGKLVVVFDTGEKIVTDAIAITDLIEQYITINSPTKEAGTIAGNVKYLEYPLSGESFVIHKEEHGLESILGYYAKDKFHNEISLAVQVNHIGKITITSNLPMTDMTFHLSGIVV